MADSNDVAIQALSTAADVTGMYIQNKGSRKRQKEAQEYNLKLWNMQNEYNDPSSQMARLRRAGLNPHLIYGDSVSGATGRADAPAPTKPAPYEAPRINPLGFQQYRMQEAQTNNLRTQNTVLEQDALIKSAVAANEILKGKVLEADSEVAKELKQYQLEASKLANQNLEQIIIGNQLDNDFKDLTIKDRVKDIYYRAKNAEANLEGQYKLNELRKLEVELKELGLENSPWYSRIFGRFFENELRDIQKGFNEFKKRF